jgi:hypothetical protein
MNFLPALLCFLFIGTSLHISAQQFPDLVNAKDSLRYVYSFVKGDTLLYEAISRDSILIEKQPPLLRDRKERFLLSCDSVDAKGRMYLSQRLIDFSSSEYSGISQIIDRKTHEWKNKKISFIIDSTGKRHGFSAEDSAKAILSPGSAFQPLMFQFLGSGYHLINSGWIAEDTVDAPEFGIPAPMIRYLSSMRARPLFDTLDFTCSQFESTISAQGTYLTNTQSGQSLRTNAVIAGYARMAMSDKLHIPIHFFGTNENKNTMIIGMPKGNLEQKVRHYVTTNITLQKMVSIRGTYGPVANVKSKSVKKSKVKKNK